jgi:hypothetical protein
MHAPQILIMEKGLALELILTILSISEYKLAKKRVIRKIKILVILKSQVKIVK